MYVCLGGLCGMFTFKLLPYNTKHNRKNGCLSSAPIPDSNNFLTRRGKQGCGCKKTQNYCVVLMMMAVKSSQVRETNCLHTFDFFMHIKQTDS